jgi:hypothetical protein
VILEMTVSDYTIRAADYCAPEDGAVDSAMRLAASILEAMKSNEKIFVSMESIPVASSSFFNVIFSELAAKLGPEAVKKRIAFVGLGKTQTMIETRSRVAVLGS